VHKYLLRGYIDAPFRVVLAFVLGISRCAERQHLSGGGDRRT